MVGIIWKYDGLDPEFPEIFSERNIRKDLVTTLHTDEISLETETGWWQEDKEGIDHSLTCSSTTLR